MILFILLYFCFSYAFQEKNIKILQNFTFSFMFLFITFFSMVILFLFFLEAKLFYNSKCPSETFLTFILSSYNLKDRQLKLFVKFHILMEYNQLLNIHGGQIAFIQLFSRFCLNKRFLMNVVILVFCIFVCLATCTSMSYIFSI